MKPEVHSGSTPHHRTTEIVRSTQPVEKTGTSPERLGSLGSLAVDSISKPAEQHLPTEESNAEAMNCEEDRKQFRADVTLVAELLDDGRRLPWATRFVKNVANRFTTTVHDGKSYNVVNDVLGVKDQPLVMNTAASRRVAEAGPQMEAEEEKYEADVALVTTSIRAFDNKKVQETQGSMVRRGTSWAGMNKFQSDLAMEKLHSRGATSKQMAEAGKNGDIFDKVMANVAMDLAGTLPGVKANATDFNTGGRLVDMVDNSEVHTSEVIEKATKAIEILAINGSYKFHKWNGPSGQLTTALEAMEAFTKFVPGFDPNQADFESVKSMLLASKAALGAEFRLNPNYSSARPELSIRLADLNRLSGIAERIEAHVFLRDHVITRQPELQDA